MTSNNNHLLDLATNVRLVYTLMKEEGRINGKEEYYQGRLDAYRSVSEDIREKLGLGEAEFETKITERFAFKQISKLIPTKTLTERGTWEAYEDGRYVITCKEGRVINVEEDHKYNQQLREK